MNSKKKQEKSNLTNMLNNKKQNDTKQAMKKEQSDPKRLEQR